MLQADRDSRQRFSGYGSAITQTSKHMIVPLSVLVTHTLLRTRRDYPSLFAAGSYEPLGIQGPQSDQLIGFLRRHGRQGALALAPRRTCGVDNDDY